MSLLTELCDYFKTRYYERKRGEGGVVFRTNSKEVNGLKEIMVCICKDKGPLP